MRIEICGGIATGKTTLCNRFAKVGIHSVFENFQSNPFWEDFYKNPELYAFETELSFCLQHYHLIKTNRTYPEVTSDFSLVQDLAYADINLNQQRHELFCSLEYELRNEIGFPDAIIHLYCPENVQLERIKSRGRSQESDIPEEYLKSLNRALIIRLDELDDFCRIIHIDSSKIDFRDNLPVDLEVIFKSVFEQT